MKGLSSRFWFCVGGAKSERQRKQLEYLAAGELDIEISFSKKIEKHQHIKIIQKYTLDQYSLSTKRHFLIDKTRYYPHSFVPHQPPK